MNGTDVAILWHAMTQTPTWMGAVLCLALLACSSDSGDADSSSGGGSGSGGTSAGGAANSGTGGTADCDCMLGAYRPACGTDGQTYDATCGLHCVPVTIACEGECPCDTATGGASAYMDCPTGAPTHGAPCSLSTPPICEYGEHTERWCNTQASCKYNQAQGPESAAWVVTEASEACEAPMGNPVDCPEDFASVPTGDCEIDGLTCAYAEGTCGCRMQFRGQVRRTPQWYCESLMAGCPPPRPLLGAPCDEESLLCDYGLCFEDGRPAMVCVRGYWMEAAVSCGEPPVNP